MTPGTFTLLVHVAGFTLECALCGKEIYDSESSTYNQHDAHQILQVAVAHNCPAPPERAA